MPERSVTPVLGRFGKDPDCPNCGGRSFSAVDPGDYYGCQLCEPHYATAKFQAWYRGKWPEAFVAWTATAEGEARIANAR